MHGSWIKSTLEKTIGSPNTELKSQLTAPCPHRERTYTVDPVPFMAWWMSEGLSSFGEPKKKAICSVSGDGSHASYPPLSVEPLRGPAVNSKVKSRPPDAASDMTFPEEMAPAAARNITCGPSFLDWNFMSYSPSPKSFWIWIPRQTPSRISGVSAEQVSAQVEFCWQVLPWHRPPWQ